MCYLSNNSITSLIDVKTASSEVGYSTYHSRSEGLIKVESECEIIGNGRAIKS